MHLLVDPLNLRGFSFSGGSSLYTHFLSFFFFCLAALAFVAVHGLSLIVVSRGYSPLRCPGFLLWRPLLLRSTGSRHAGFSNCDTWGLSCPVACVIFPEQGSSLCPLHWQVGSSPLDHEGSPTYSINVTTKICFGTGV